MYNKYSMNTSVSNIKNETSSMSHIIKMKFKIMCITDVDFKNKHASERQCRTVVIN